MSIWYHQSQHPSPILSEVHLVSSESPTHSPRPLICLCPGKLIRKASSVYLAFWLPIGFSQQEAQTGGKSGKDTGGHACPHLLHDSMPLFCLLHPPPMISAPIRQALLTGYHPLCPPLVPSALQVGPVYQGCFNTLCWFPYPCLTPVRSLFIRGSLMESSEFNSASCQDLNPLLGKIGGLAIPHDNAL